MRPRGWPCSMWQDVWLLPGEVQVPPDWNCLAANEKVRRTLGGPGKVAWPGCPGNRPARRSPAVRSDARLGAHPGDRRCLGVKLLWAPPVERFGGRAPSTIAWVRL
jgi:hypothetical protein